MRRSIYLIGGKESVVLHCALVDDVRVRDGSGETAGCAPSHPSAILRIQNYTPPETGYLLDQSFGSKESIIFLSEFLHELLVLVKPYMKHEKRQTRKKIALRTSSNHQQTCTQEKSP